MKKLSIRHYFFINSIVAATMGAFLGVEEQPGSTMLFVGAFVNLLIYFLLKYKIRQHN
jgi:hypothetical protein